MELTKRDFGVSILKKFGFLRALPSPAAKKFQPPERDWNWGLFFEYATLRREAPPAPPLGELLSEREAEGVRYEIWDMLQNTNDTLSATR